MRFEFEPSPGPLHISAEQVFLGLGPSGFDFAQQRQTLRPSVGGIRSKALRPFGLQ
jgi:hypothetical protein